MPLKGLQGFQLNILLSDDQLISSQTKKCFPVKETKERGDVSVDERKQKESLCALFYSGG